MTTELTRGGTVVLRLNPTEKTWLRQVINNDGSANTQVMRDALENAIPKLIGI